MVVFRLERTLAADFAPCARVQVKDATAALACANLRPENWREYCERDAGVLLHLMRLVPRVAQEASRFIFWLVTIAFMSKPAAKAHTLYARPAGNNPGPFFQSMVKSGHWPAIRLLTFFRYAALQTRMSCLQ
jgi:hypothetical protein